MNETEWINGRREEESKLILNFTKYKEYFAKWYDLKDPKLEFGRTGFQPQKIYTNLNPSFSVFFWNFSPFLLSSECTHTFIHSNQQAQAHSSCIPVCKCRVHNPGAGNSQLGSSSDREQPIISFSSFPLTSHAFPTPNTPLWASLPTGMWSTALSSPNSHKVSPSESHTF